MVIIGIILFRLILLVDSAPEFSSSLLVLGVVVVFCVEVGMKAIVM